MYNDNSDVIHKRAFAHIVCVHIDYRGAFASKNDGSTAVFCNMTNLYFITPGLERDLILTLRYKDGKWPQDKGYISIILLYQKH